MAKSPLKIESTILFFTILFFALPLLPVPVNSHGFSRTLSKKEAGINQKEKLTHLHFYFHDIVSGRNPTAVRVAEAAVTNTSATSFGAVVVIDDPLTEGPDMSSRLVGSAQGMYSLAAKNEAGLLMVFNCVFVEGECNGSTLSILGRNEVFSKVREMPIVGGSGVFRYARGHVEAKTYTFDLKTGDAVVEYNAYALHY